MSVARTSIMDAADQFASRGVLGVKQFVNRFYFGPLAAASGPNNRLSQAAGLVHGPSRQCSPAMPRSITSNQTEL